MICTFKHELQDRAADVLFCVLLAARLLLNCAGQEEWGIYNFKATIAYKGTAYKGWQIQNGRSKVPTIQDRVEAALSAVKCESRRLLRIQGAGRTDAGVHARGQVTGPLEFAPGS